MAKKRLVDLLREEAQKTPEVENEAVQRRQEMMQQAPLEVEAVQDSAQELEADATSSPALTSRSRRTGPTKAELETTVAELREVVQEAQRQETYLQQRNEDLQSALEEQKALVEELQTELKQAKKVILQLSEANTKTPQEKVSKSQKVALRKAPHHTIQPNSLPEMFSNKDIGWAD